MWGSIVVYGDGEASRGLAEATWAEVLALPAVGPAGAPACGRLLLVLLFC